MTKLIVFDQDRIIKSFESRKPDIEGNILDWFSYKSVNGADASFSIICKKPVRINALRFL